MAKIQMTVQQAEFAAELAMGSGDGTVRISQGKGSKSIRLYPGAKGKTWFKVKADGTSPRDNEPVAQESPEPAVVEQSASAQLAQQFGT